MCHFILLRWEDPVSITVFIWAWALLAHSTGNLSRGKLYVEFPVHQVLGKQMYWPYGGEKGSSLLILKHG